MPQTDWPMVMGLGGLFLVIGIALILAGRGEQKAYYDSITDRTDVREFLSHEPERPELGALKIGGFIALAVGLVTLLVGAALWLWG